MRTFSSFAWSLHAPSLSFLRSHGSSVSLYTNVYKHVYGDFTKDEKEKSQYQDTICSEAEEGNGDQPLEVLYEYIVDPAASQPSEETSGTFPLT